MINKLPVEIFKVIFDLLDVKSLLSVAMVSNHLQNVILPLLRNKQILSKAEFHKKNTVKKQQFSFLSMLNPATKDKKLDIFQDKFSETFHDFCSCRDNTVNVLLYKRLYIKIDLWLHIHLYNTQVLQILEKHKLVNHGKIAKSLEKCEWDENFKSEQTKLSDNALYRIWEKLFLMPMYTDTGEIVSLKKYKPFITSLTERVLLNFRKEIIINEKFIDKLFQHEMEMILIYLYENQRFFNISNMNLTDIYLMNSCDKDNISMFIKLTKNVNINHLEYAVRFSSQLFLMSLWKIRRYIPNFDENMKILKKTMKGKDSKHYKFFDWCEKPH